MSSSSDVAQLQAEAEKVAIVKANLTVCEQRLLKLFEIPVISDKNLNPKFQDYILSKKRVNPNYYSQLCLIQSLEEFSNLIGMLDLSLRYVPSVLMILNNLLSSVIIFDPEIQESIKPLLQFLKHFQETDDTITSILTDYETIMSFSINTQAKYEKQFTSIFHTYCSAIIEKANTKKSIQGDLQKILDCYIQVTEDSNLNQLYARKKLILELICLQGLKYIKSSRSKLSFLLRDLNEINDGITFLLHDQRKLQMNNLSEAEGSELSRAASAISTPKAEAGEQIKKIKVIEDDVKSKPEAIESEINSESEFSFSSSFAFKVIAVTAAVTAAIGLAIVIGILTAGVAPTVATIAGAGLLIAAHPGTTTVLTMASIGGLSWMVQTFFGKNAVKNKPAPKVFSASSSNVLGNLLAGFRILGRV